MQTPAVPSLRAISLSPPRGVRGDSTLRGVQWHIAHSSPTNDRIVRTTCTTRTWAAGISDSKEPSPKKLPSGVTTRRRRSGRSTTSCSKRTHTERPVASSTDTTARRRRSISNRAGSTGRSTRSSLTCWTTSATTHATSSTATTG